MKQQIMIVEVLISYGNEIFCNKPFRGKNCESNIYYHKSKLFTQIMYSKLQELPSSDIFTKKAFMPYKSLNQFYSTQNTFYYLLSFHFILVKKSMSHIFCCI